MIPFQFSGQTGEHQSVQFSREIVRNMYMVQSESSDRIGSIVFPGLKNFGTGTARDRGDHVMADVHYLINGSQLFSESSAGVRTLIGSIGGTDRAIFADDKVNLLIAVNNTLYIYNGTSLSTITQTVITNVSSVSYINRQFVITGDDQKFAISDVDSPTIYNALNFEFEKTAPDTLYRAYVFEQLIYMICSTSIVQWDNTGTGNPPVSRRTTALVNSGAAGKHCVTSTEAFMYYLGADKKVYQVVGASGRPVSTNGVAYPIESFAVVSDCIASSFVWKGQTFVMFKFPTAAAVMLYSETNNYWVELGSGTEKDVRNEYFGNAAIACYGKVLMCDFDNGNTYELDEETFTDNGKTRLWIRELPSFTGLLLGRPERKVTVSRIQLEIQKGVGLISGQGSDPRLICELSNDGGMSYGKQKFVKMGALGDHYRSVDYYAFSTGYDVKARIMGTDPVQVCIWGGNVAISDGGY